jgi:hypothetical protein
MSVRWSPTAFYCSQSEVAGVAALLVPLRQDQRETEWSQLVAPYIANRRAAGVPEPELQRRIAEFAGAVGAEICRLERTGEIASGADNQ